MTASEIYSLNLDLHVISRKKMMTDHGQVSKLLHVGRDHLSDATIYFSTNTYMNDIFIEQVLE